MQAQQSIAVGEVASSVLEAAALAREAYDICLQELKPGVRFANVCNTMRTPLRRDGAEQLTPMVHSMKPLYCVDEYGQGVGR